MPAANFNGADGFTYVANDGSLDSSVATVVAHGDAGERCAGRGRTWPSTTPRTRSLTGDARGDRRRQRGADVPDRHRPGARDARCHRRRRFTYLPALDFNGSDCFTYVANDGALDSNVATVSLTVTPVNDAPVARA